MNIMFLLADKSKGILSNCCNYHVFQCVRSLPVTKSLKFKTFQRISQVSRTLHYSVEKVQNSNCPCKWTRNICQQKLLSSCTRNLCNIAPHPPVESQESRTFRDLLAFRQQQAKHSIIIQLNREDLLDACSFCEQFGDAKKFIHYNSLSKNDFLIVEYVSAEVVHALLKSCKHDVESIPVYSHLLYFEKTKKYSKGKSEITCESVTPNNGTNIYLEPHKSTTISEKIEGMYQQERMTDLGTRLRFLVCAQLEDALSGMFPQCKIYPFGSSVNGFGRNNCDLDLILRHYPHQSNPGSPLIFKTKKPLANHRVHDQRSLETLSNILRNFLPGIVHVQEILHARVPIVKFHHDQLELKCDLSVSQMSGLHMSELLYLCGELDARVRPLVFAVKKWAKAAHLTNSSPGYWITNFSISLLMIFFLQTRPCPILPPLNTAFNPSALQFCDSLEDIGIKNCHEWKSTFHNTNTETLDVLLKEFFHFIEAFPFGSRSISVFDGQTRAKRDHSPLLIQNPLDHQHNVSKNVNQEEVNHMCEAARSTLWTIETNINDKGIKPWNFLNIFESANTGITKLQNFSVSSLFDKESNTYITNNKNYQVVAIADSDKEIKISIPVKKHKQEFPAQKNIQEKSNVSKYQVVPNINSKKKSKRNRAHILSAKDIWRRW